MHKYVLFSNHNYSESYFETHCIFNTMFLYIIVLYDATCIVEIDQFPEQTESMQQ